MRRFGAALVLQEQKARNLGLAPLLFTAARPTHFVARLDCSTPARMTKIEL
jgi:hypothetical protein